MSAWADKVKERMAFVHETALKLQRRAEKARRSPTTESRDEIPTLVQDCPECANHWFAEGQGLLHAFASVGIERGKSSWEMAESYFANYHGKRHPS